MRAAALLLACCALGARGGLVHLRSRVIDTARESRHAAALEAGGDGLQHYVVAARASHVRGVGAALEAAFGHRPHHVPSNAYVVYGAEETVLALAAAHRWVEWFGVLRPADKMDPDLVAQLQDTDAAGARFRLVVRARVGANTTLAAARDVVEDWRSGDEEVFGSAAFGDVTLYSNGLPVKPLRLHGRLVVDAAALGDEIRVDVAGEPGSLWDVAHALAALGEVYWVAPAPEVDSQFRVFPAEAPDRHRRSGGALSIDDPQGFAHWVVQSGKEGEVPCWDNGIDGRGHAVALGDTGLDTASCYVADAAQGVSLYPNTSTLHRKLVTVQPSNCECEEGEGLQGDVTDEVNGKGTHHAGLLVGQRLEAPEDGFQGLAKNARLFFQDLQNPTLSDASLTGIYPGVDLTGWYLSAPYDAGVRVHASPWGSGPRLSPNDQDGLGGLGPRSPVGYTNYASDADTYVWRNKDFLLLASVGNDGQRGVRCTHAPANAKNVIGVGAHAVTLANGAWSFDDVPFFSSSGPTWDGRIKPEFVLPGTDVRSTAAGSDCGTVLTSGADAATALGAGAAVLVRQYLTDGINGLTAVPSPRADLVKAVLVASTDPLHGVKRMDFDDPVGVKLNGTWPSWQGGYGRVNLANVLHFDNGESVLVQRPKMWFDHEAVFTSHAQGDYFAWCFEVLDIEDHRVPLRIVLSWTDYPAALFADTALVTDLNLLVSDDTGATWKGNAARYPDRPADDLNTVEAVYIPEPVPGRYIIYAVLAKPLIDAVVQDGGQPFSVVVSGPVTQPSPATCPLFYCASDCSGNGECIKKPGTVMGTQVTLPTCECADHYTHVDCSVPSCAAAEECSNNGCVGDDGTCTCYADPVYGFWAGGICDVCASTHTGTNAAGASTCTIDRGCSFHGTFIIVGGGGTNGVCECQEESITGWWGGESCLTCKEGYFGASCRCGSAYCSGHGQCGPEGCVCQETDKTGHWAAELQYHDCAKCAEGWFGDGCRCSNETCHGHGNCTLGGCVCDDSAERGHWELAASTCNTCQAGWTGEGCNCKLDVTTEEVCGGRGVCSSAAGCECHQNGVTGYWGSEKEGVCDVCNGGFGSNCLCRDLLCSNHGTCTDWGCICDDSDAAGHWMVVDSTCQVCKPGWYGDGCRCQSSDCDLHGTCMPYGCECYKTWHNSDPAKVGFFDGDGSRCNKCRGGWSVYPYCLCETEDCNGHGRCTPGGCTCQEADVENGQGAYAPEDPLVRKDCTVCAAGYSGSDCTCGMTNCAQEYNSGEPLERTFNIHRHTYGNATYNASVTVKAEAGAVVKAGGGLTVEMMFKRVENTVQAHPRKSPPGQLIFMESAWILECYLRERVGGENRTIPGSMIDLAGYMVVEGEWSETMEFGVKADPSSVRLKVLTPSGWQDATDSCPGGVQQAVSDIGFFQTRICRLYSNAIYALFAEELVVVNHLPMILGTVFGILAAVLLVVLAAKKIKEKFDEERRVKEAKNQIIQFMQRRKNEPSLRQRLGLEPDQEFSPEYAAHKLLGNLKKKRGLFALLMRRTEFRKIQQLTEAMVGAKMTGDSRDNIAALAALTEGEKPIRKIWEFREGELNLLEACRLVRGMILDSAETPQLSLQEQRFGEEVKLRQDALPAMQKELVETKAENVKLRRIIHALQLADIRTDASGVMLQPKQPLYPAGATGTRNVKAVPSSVLKAIATKEGGAAKTVNFKPPEDNPLHPLVPPE